MKRIYEILRVEFELKSFGILKFCEMCRWTSDTSLMFCRMFAGKAELEARLLTRSKVGSWFMPCPCRDVILWKWRKHVEKSLKGSERPLGIP